MEELCVIIARESMCPSCQQELQEPKVLSCSHTFCLQCVTQLGSESFSKVTCPKCKTDTAFQSEDASGLPTNAVMVSLLCAVRAFKVEHGLEEKVGLWKFKLKEVDLPSMDCANGIAATQDNRIGLVDRFGGIHLYLPSGSRETILPGVEKIQGVAFFKNGRFAVLFSDNSIRLYNSSSQCLGVRFETMGIEDGGCSVLSGDTEDNVYVGYNDRAKSKIQTFAQEGGKPVREIPCIGFKAKKLSVVASGDLLVADICYKDGEVRSSRVLLIDETGREKWSIEREGVQAQVANGENDTVLISWLRSESANHMGLLTIEKYSKDMKDMKTLISDCDVITSTCPSYHLQQFSSGELVFCTADKLYIFTNISDGA